MRHGCAGIMQPVSIWEKCASGHSGVGAEHMAASTIPHSPFGLVVRLSATHKRAQTQTVSGPPQSPTRSLEVSGSQTDPNLER